MPPSIVQQKSSSSFFSSQKNGPKKKTSGTLITSSGVLQLCTRTFDVIQSSSRSTALCWIAWIFFFEKNLHNFREGVFYFVPWDFFSTENTSSSLRVDETKGNYEGALGRAKPHPPKKNEIGKLILNHPPLLSKKSSLDCRCYLSRGCKYILIMLNRLKPNTSET